MTRDDDSIFETFRRHGVPFVIIGGHAVNYHGRIRNTEDADIVWRRSANAEHALLIALTEMDAKWIGKEIDPATGIEREYPVTLAYIHSTHLMMLCTKWGFLDVFSYIPGLPEVPVEQLFDTSVTDGRYHFASRDWLVQMKTKAGRSKDLEDLAQLPDPPKS